EVTLLCAKRLYLERDAADPGLFHSPDREWTGRTEEDRLLISREDGWELVFREGKVERLRTDHGAMIIWTRDEAGRLLS
ncbi:MAG TPA: hypothetical protein PLA50_08820, partial [Bacteroidia bacterium]|nr:hypothetical protein [Bacteroidia bacterium]